MEATGGGLAAMDAGYLAARARALRREIEWVETERDGALGEATAAREEVERLARMTEELAHRLAGQGTSWNVEAQLKHEELERARLVASYHTKFQQLQEELNAAADERDELDRRLLRLLAKVTATREQRECNERARAAERTALAAALAAAPRPPPPLEQAAPSSPLPRTRRALARYPSAPLLPAPEKAEASQDNGAEDSSPYGEGGRASVATLSPPLQQRLPPQTVDASVSAAARDGATLPTCETLGPLPVEHPAALPDARRGLLGAAAAVELGPPANAPQARSGGGPRGRASAGRRARRGLNRGKRAGSLRGDRGQRRDGAGCGLRARCCLGGAHRRAQPRELPGDATGHKQALDAARTDTAMRCPRA